MEPNISIIVPVYNAERYLETCLESLQEQTYTDIEIILIDDGSTDRSSEICKAFSEKDSRFVYVYQNNAGVSAARNRGIELARGSYIGFCDSDDWAEPDMYEILYSLLKETDADVSIISRLQGNAPVCDAEDDKTVRILNGREALLEMHRGELFQGQLWDKLVKKELIGEDRLPEDIAVFEDMLFLQALFCKAKKVAFQNIHRYHYIYNPNSALYGAFKESFRTVRTASQRMLCGITAVYPEDHRYGEKTLLLGNYALAEKLASSGRLTKDEYLLLKKDFDAFYTDETKVLFSSYHQGKIRCFLKGRVSFLFYVRLKKLYGRIRRKK